MINIQYNKNLAGIGNSAINYTSNGQIVPN